MATARRSVGEGWGTGVRVSVCTRGGCSGVSRISTRSRPPGPRSHHRRWAGEACSTGTPGSGVSAPSSSRIAAIRRRRAGSGSSSSTFPANSRAARSSSQSASSRSTAAAAASVAGHGPPGAGAGPRPADSPGGAPGQHDVEDLLREHVGRRVRAVREHDDTEPAVGVPAHVASRIRDSRRCARRASRTGGGRRRRARSRSAAARSTGGASTACHTTSGGYARCGCCCSRRVARRSGWPPSGSSRGGKASVSSPTHRARSRTELNTPPIGAKAP